MSYTKEEWKVEGTTVYAECPSNANQCRFWAECYSSTDATKEELVANARLMAASPLLLEALQAVTQTLSWQYFGECRGFDEGLLAPKDAVDKALAAIKKALGE
jgi:hypothetical protein